MVDSTPKRFVAKPTKATSKSFLIEYADKILILAIPYSLIVSCLHYFGYWGNLDFDVFNYMGVQDLVKGVGYSISKPIFITIIMSTLIFIVTVFMSLFKDYAKLEKFIFAFFLIVLFSIIIVFSYKYSDAKYKDEFRSYMKHGLVEYVLFSISGIISLLILWREFFFTLYALKFSFENILSRKITNFFIKSSIINFLIALPFISFFEGYYKSINIINNYKFDYIYNTDPNKFDNYKYIKYLGKVGDYYFMMTFDNKRRIIVDKSSMPFLTIRKFELDKKSIHYKSILQQKTPVK